MTKEKELLYKNAYSELNEILKVLSKEQKDKIPSSFIENVRKNMNVNYKFQYDMSKGIFEQDLLLETKALLVEIYEKYLAKEQDKEIWDKYDKFCLNKIENEKREKYNINVFEKNESNENNLNDNIKIDSIEEDKENLPIIYKKENVIKKIINKIKSFFGIS